MNRTGQQVVIITGGSQGGHLTAATGRSWRSR
jgi:acetyl esterase/lipase